jgi:surface protein
MIVVDSTDTNLHSDTNLSNSDANDEAIIQSFFQDTDDFTSTAQRGSNKQKSKEINTELQAWRENNLKQLKLNTSDLTITDIELGQGGFGIVSIGYLRGTEVAVKSFKKRKTYGYSDSEDGSSSGNGSNGSSDTYVQVENEILVMKILGNSPTLLSCYGYTLSPTGMHVVLELAPYGSLAELLYSDDIFPEIPVSLTLAWLCDMVDALCFIHNKQVKHKDIKADNFLVFHMFRIKLCDFGLAKEHHSCMFTSLGGGTLAFMAPEVKVGENSSFASDIYSFAITAIQVITRIRPFANRRAIDQIKAAIENVSINQSMALQELLSHCVNCNPKERPTAQEVYDQCNLILSANGGDPRMLSNDHYYGLIDEMDRKAITIVQRMRRRSEEQYNAMKKKKFKFNNVNIRAAPSMWCQDRTSALELFGDISTWDTSEVTDMTKLFAELKDFNDDITQWDVHNVTSMKFMFHKASSFNQPLNNWNVSKVTDMSGMFYSAKVFNQPLDKWDVSRVTDMNNMFKRAAEFNQPLNNWNVSNVTDTYRLFCEASSFDQPLDNWDVSNVTDMNDMFNKATNFNQNLSDWQVYNVKDMTGMFSFASKFNQPLRSWKVDNVTDMDRMFQQASSFNQPLEEWNVSNVTIMKEMFHEASNFNQSIERWDVGKVTDMTRMFNRATAFNQPLTTWNTISVTDMSEMFSSSSSFNQPLNHWSVDKVTNMCRLFHQATAFNQPLDNWHVEKVMNMSEMFRGASSFNQPLDTWETKNVTDMTDMFADATSFSYPTCSIKTKV